MPIVQGVGGRIIFTGANAAGAALADDHSWSTGDVKVALPGVSGGVYANATVANISALGSSSGEFALTLDAGEAANVGEGAIWVPATGSYSEFKRTFEIQAAAVGSNITHWNGTAVENLSGAGHIKATMVEVGDESTGLLNWFGLYQLELAATAGSASGITLATGGVPTNFLRGTYLNIVSATGQGQARYIVSNNNANPTVCVVDEPWVVEPDNTSLVQLRFWRRPFLMDDEITAAAIATSAVDKIVAAIFANEHYDGRNLKGLARRLEQYLTGELEGMLGPTWTLKAPDGSTLASGSQDVVAGTREQATIINGD